MYYFLFSLSCVMPIFLVMLVGLYLKHSRLVNKEGFKTLNMIAFQVGFPTLLFYDVATSDLRAIFDFKLVFFIMFATVFSYALIWVIGNSVIKDKASLGSFVQGSIRGNYIVIGLSLVNNIMGGASTKAVLVIAFVVPLYNVLAIIVLTVCSNTQNKISPLILLTSIFKNPLIISVLLGIVFSLFSIKIPGVFDKAIGYLASLGTPIALLSIGGSLEYEGARKSFNLAATSTLLKIVISPLIVCTIAYFLGFDNESLIIIYVLFGAPTAVTSYIMAAHMGCNSTLAASLVVFTTTLSVFTYTIGITALQVLQII